MWPSFKEGVSMYEKYKRIQPGNYSVSIKRDGDCFTIKNINETDREKENVINDIFFQENGMKTYCFSIAEYDLLSQYIIKDYVKQFFIKDNQFVIPTDYLIATVYAGVKDGQYYAALRSDLKCTVDEEKWISEEDLILFVENAKKEFRSHLGSNRSRDNRIRLCLKNNEENILKVERLKSILNSYKF